MVELGLTLLGPVEVSLDGEPARGLNSDYLRALLAYVAVESGREHARETLASLLWPERPDREALSALRHALSNLRHALSDRRAPSPFLHVSRSSVRFNCSSDHWLDVTEYEALKGCPDRESLERAVALYRGPFLQGLSLGESPTFEEWVLLKGEEYRRDILSVLGRLASLEMAGGDYGAAARWARRQLELEPYRERAHRQLMAALALGGERAAALAHYEACCLLLAEELGCAPDDETQALCAQIRAGSVPRLQPSPARLSAAVLPRRTAATWRPGRFVAREQELARLGVLLQRALAGAGGVALIAGEAGGGKTALLDEWARQAVAAHDDLVVLRGSCNAYAGAGDPYLPFREILQTLAGDVEGKRAGGTLSPEQARRVWEALPQVGAALMAHGVALIDTFVPGEALLQWAEAFPGPPATRRWEGQLREMVRPVQGGSARASHSGLGMAAPRPDLFAQVTQVLHAVSLGRPLLLAIDDLQWADGGTVALLFHLGRRLAGSRLMLACAYRPDALETAEKNDASVPGLATVLQELRREWGDVLIDLDRADGRTFVEAYVDGEPNRLGQAFRQALYDHTGGNPLFTVELLLNFERTGDLVRDEAGRWVQAPGLAWDHWPAHLDAVIARWLECLPEEELALLQAASVQGEPFAAEVVAQALGRSEEAVVRRLSGRLSAQRLVHAVRLDRLPGSGQRLSTYRFRHRLFQQYLYGQLDQVQRVKLHEAVGLALEIVYGVPAGGVAPEVARHFEAAGQVERAAHYWLLAGKRAMEVSAHPEAVQHFQRGLELLSNLSHSAERDRQELDLQLSLGAALLTTEGMGSQAQILAYRRAYELSGRLGETVALWPALHALASSSTARGQYEHALELGEQLLALAEQSEEPAVLALAHFTLGATRFASGNSLLRAREHLEQAIRTYDGECDGASRRLLTALNLFDVGVNARAWLAGVLWILGYPEQALRRSQEAMERAEQRDHLMSRVLALYAAGHASQHAADDRALGEVVQALEQLVRGKQLLVGEVWVDVFGGWLLVRSGQVEAGLARLRQGTEAWLRTGAVFGTTSQLILLADACLLARRPEEGLAVIEKALQLVARTGARPNEAELYRLQGELLLARGDEADTTGAEASFGQALALARAGEQKSWELRAALSLACLQRAQGRRDEARALLAASYGRFTEGFDTVDLAEARALLARWA